MLDSKYGISLPAIAVIAFIFCVFNQPLMILLLCGYAVVLERNEWLMRQTFSALTLNILYVLLLYAVDFLFGWMYGIQNTFNFLSFLPVNFASIFFWWVNSAIWILMVVFALIAILRVSKGNHSNVPIVNSIANKVVRVMGR